MSVAEIGALIETDGVDETLENVAEVCRNMADTYDEMGNVDTSRKWRVRANGVMQALKFYQNFVKERNAA